ncbi:MAG: RluA family pseudouridine synthase [Treponema sp.]|nr:RluA family pseudouridine synthase [Treponema sp.]
MKTLLLKPQKNISLNEYLRAELPAVLSRDISNSKVRRLIMAGMVRVNGVQCRNPSAKLRAGESVTVLIDEEKVFYEKQPDDIAFDVTARDVLYEDDVILVVNKPAFFPVEAGMTGSRDNLHAAVVRYLFEKQKREHPAMKNPPYAGIMHRLDRETSGVILFTKARTVNAACHDMFENHTVQKCYRAVVMLQPHSRLAKESAFSVEMYMGRISPKSQAAKWGALKEKDGGVYSKTDFSLAGTGRVDGKSVAFADCLLHTGRTHQIRVHLASVGSPILGDVLYGGAPYKRIMLHAQSLSFPHPVTGEMMTVTAPFPTSVPFCPREKN